MRTIIAVGACVALTFIGCGQKQSDASKATNSTTTGNPITAPVDYLGAVGRAKKVAEKTVDTVSLKQAIQLFHALEGRYPNDLQELVKGGHLRQLPTAPSGMKINYDPTTGQVAIVAK